MGQPEIVEVQLGDELKDWRKSKKAIPSLLASDIAEKHLVYKHPMVQDSISLHQAQIQLHKAYTTSPLNAKAIGFVANPMGACALQAFAVGALVLKPYGSLYPVKDQEKAKVKVLIGNFGVAAPKITPEFDKIDEKTVLVPFWYVKSTGEEDVVNMELQTKTFANLVLPCYVNCKALDPGEVLLCANETLAKKRKIQQRSVTEPAQQSKASTGKRAKN